MGKINSHTEHLYQGYLNTCLLWTSDAVLKLKQLQISSKPSFFKRPLDKQLRLGQLAEQFAFNQLEGIENCNILAENVQVQREKQTLGELDALIEFNSELIHLEIVYKFYLYDETLGASEIERWIGPNRNDSLNEKVRKLKAKQFPLLDSSECESTLGKLHLNSQNFRQYVLFKAQLFVPYKQTVSFNQLNENCLSGFYIYKNQLEDFSTCQFNIPSKLDWFLEPNNSVDWLTIDQFMEEVELFLSQFKSPLIWIKKPNGKLFKCFLVWW
jgi:hypothetical protein